jgi:hypothetical protein
VAIGKDDVNLAIELSVDSPYGQCKNLNTADDDSAGNEHIPKEHLQDHSVLYKLNH